MITVTFAVSVTGRSYFEKFIKDLSSADRVVILSVFKNIQQHGLSAKGFRFRQIDRKLWEIKIKSATGSYRFFYIMLTRDHIHVLHFYKKQGQKAPLKEIETANKRLREVLKNEN